MDPFIGQIVMFGGNFAPRGWALCDGQLLAISSNSALFSILGTIYGGDGRTSFGLPDLRGRTPIGAGSGPGLPTYREGQRGGNYQNTLTIANLPSHSHTGTIKTTNDNGDSGKSAGNYIAKNAVDADGITKDFPYNDTTHPLAKTMAANTLQIDNTGGGQSFSIMSPFLAINYIIALQGVFPSRN